MNEELQKALGELLSKANSGIDAASGFLSAELPEVIQQLLMWHAYKSVLISLCAAFLSVFCYRKIDGMLASAAKSDCNEAEWCLGIGVVFFVSVIALVVSVKNALNVIQIWIAPKVWLIEYASQLAK